MKVAILLLAHKNKAQLERLLSLLDHEDVDVYVHLDKKCNFEPQDIDSPTKVTFTDKRYDVGLFEFSMVDAEFELINTAKRNGDYKYFILMSGQCYPLDRIDRIVSYLDAHYPEPFIEIIAPTEHNYVKKNFKHVYILKRFKLKTYDFLKKHFSFKGYRVLRYIPGGFVFAVSTLKELFVKSPKRRLEKMGYSVYCGSQWWILPDHIIEKAESAYNDKAFCKAVSDTFSCDETFFQTVIMNHQKECGVELDSDNNFVNRKWFYIFDGGHPITLTKSQADQIKESGMLFARKFDIDVDSKVLDEIDCNIKTLE
ncbi:MAG: hypothetical protein J6S71_10075 [Clostridia bacterium]|nr:hypothetical protein [Clostridia bacterium]